MTLLRKHLLAAGLLAALGTGAIAQTPPPPVAGPAQAQPEAGGQDRQERQVFDDTSLRLLRGAHSGKHSGYYHHRG